VGAAGSMAAYLQAGPGRGVVPRVPEQPGVTDSGDGGLRAANARLRELLAERDARIAGQDAEIAELRELLAGLQLQVADLSARVQSNSRNSSRPPSSDGLAKPSPKSLRGRSERKPGPTSRPPPATASAHSKPSPAPFRAIPGTRKPDRPAQHQSSGPPSRITAHLSSYAENSV
jgi:Family of unknown function (DUF6444)